MNTFAKITTIILAITIIFSVGYCKKKKSDTDKIWLHKPGKKKYAVLKVKKKTRKIKFEYADRTRILKGKQTKTGKRMYELAEDVKDRKEIPKEKFKTIAKIIGKPRGNFKMRDKDGKLIWKINLTPEGNLKISDNNKNENPFTTNIIGNEIKVWDSGKKVGRVKFDGKKVRIINSAGKRIFTSRAERKTAMFAVLLMDRIPEVHKFVIMTEIWIREK